MSSATVLTDASFCSETRAAGWAAWIVMNGNRLKKSGRFYKRPRTSTEAEKWACYNGIWLASQWGAKSILIQTDCKSLVDSRPHNYDGTAKAYWPGAEVRWKHVKAHTVGASAATHCNNWCDTEAKKHMRKQRDGK